MTAFTVILTTPTCCSTQIVTTLSSVIAFLPPSFLSLFLFSSLHSLHSLRLLDRFGLFRITFTFNYHCLLSHRSIMHTLSHTHTHTSHTNHIPHTHSTAIETALSGRRGMHASSEAQHCMRLLSHMKVCAGMVCVVGDVPPHCI